MSTVESRITSLSPEKRRLFDLIRQEQSAARTQSALVASPSPNGDALPNLKPFSMISLEDRRKLPPGLEDAYPLGQVQLGMLFHMVFGDQNPSTPAYHNVGAMQIQLPRFDLAAFQESINRVVARHAIFRTSFDMTNYSEPLQLVHREAALSVYYEDLRALPLAEQERICQTFIVSKNFELVDITQAPMIQFYVHQLSDTLIQFTVIEPHSISDGWSTHLTLVEILTNHDLLINNKPLPPLTPPPVSYRDFIYLERKAVESEDHRHFWQQQLADFTATKLPRWPAPASESETDWTEHKLYFRVPTHITEGLKRIARSTGLPMKNIALAAHLKVISLICGQRDVTIGLTFNGRPEARGGDDVRGLFLNTLPLRMQISSCTWIELAQQTYAAESELIPYRRYPLAQIQQDTGHQSLIDVMFSFHHFHSITDLSQSRKIDSLEAVTDLSRTNFPFEVTFHRSAEAAAQLTILIDYDITQFTRDQVLTWYGYYRRVLAAIVEDPTSRHDALNFMGAEELEQQLVQWNATAATFPKDETIHQLFQQQVRRTPDAIALVHNDQRLSYAELNQRANKLAHALRDWGVGPDSPVGVCLERTPDLLIALLAILKAGGAYVPFDPSYPSERLQFMLNDSQPQVVLTEQALLPLIPWTGRHIICLDAIESALHRYSNTDLPSCTTPDHLAYIIYSSGSTGRPKAVMVPHRGVTRLLFGVDYVQLDATETLLQMAPVSFDASTFEIWGALLHGGCCVLFPERIPTPDDIGQAIQHFGVSTLWLTASLFNTVIDEAPQVLAGVRQLLIGGEALSVHHVRRALQALPHTQIINGYGPTESTTFTCCYPIPQSLEPNIPSISIGKPIANTTVYLLDHMLQPVPIGASGELYIGGDGLARGYLNQPELTAERFTPHPWSTSPGARLYKTGDLARYLPDGRIEFLGRLDHQVKVRGFRIELGEIEATLLTHAAVREAVVRTRTDTTGYTQLVAYLAPHTSAPDITQLQSFLQGQLPHYMIPSTFVMLEKLPLTPNGKLDEQALPMPEQALHRPQDQTVLPRNETEQKIVEVWEDLFRIRPLGIHDNFFTLGGHSLLATRIITRLRAMFDVDLPLRVLFEAPTVAELAQFITQQSEQLEDDMLTHMLTEMQDLSPDELQALLVGEQLDDKDE